MHGRFTVLPFFLSALLVIGGPVMSASAQEEAKWFVLRRDETGNCWTALLIKVAGSYRHEFAQKAGGPYDTKAQALMREKELEKAGVCTKN